MARHDNKGSASLTQGAQDERKTQRRVLTIQLFTAGAAIMGAFVGPFVSIRIADSQAAANYNQSQNEFLHSQRQAAYAKFSADTELFGQILYEDSDYLKSESNDQADQADVTKYSDAIFKASNSVELDLATLRLLGSPQTVKAAETVNDSVRGMWSDASCALVKESGCQGDDKFLADKVQEMIDGDWSKVVETREEWNKAARRDLELDLATDGSNNQPSEAPTTPCDCETQSNSAAS